MNDKLEKLNQVTEEITPHFTATSTVRDIAVYLLANYEGQLTHDDMASVVQLVKAKFGLKAQTSGSCIAWYKRDVKLKGNSEQLKEVFRKHLNTMPEEDKAKILLELAKKYQEKLLSSVSDTELKSYLPINDEDPQDIPTKEQQAIARQEIARQEIAPLETKELVAAGPKKHKKK